MAKNVTLQGASYPDVPAVDLPLTGGGTARFTDTSVVTATASDVASGKVFVDANGAQVTGTASGGGGSGTLLITTNGLYNVSAYANVMVNTDGRYPAVESALVDLAII